MIVGHGYRPRALVLAVHADRRDRCCRSLIDNGYDVLGFDDAENAQAWLEEETPEVAIVDGDADPVRMRIVEALIDRGVKLIPAG